MRDERIGTGMNNRESNVRIDVWAYVLCNFCDKELSYMAEDRRCLNCDSPIENPEPTAEEGHPFPHNHKPLRTCHQDSV